MKLINKVLFTVVITLFSTTAFGQSSAADLDSQVNQAIDLMHNKKFTEAITKFNEVLKADPDNQKANYELAYTLFMSGREKEAIPYLEKLIKLNHSAGGVYDLLGSIYDDDKQPEKAIDYYLQGIKAYPEYQGLYFNIAIAYYRQGKNIEAEKYIINALKLNPKHVASQRAYAMITYYLKKRGPSLLAWCSFLMLEPRTQRSVEALGYIKNILNHGIKKGDGKNVNVTVSVDNPANLMMPLAIIEATQSKKDLSPVDSLQLQLTSLFQIAQTITGEKEDAFVLKYFADYFEKLGKSGNMPAFARLITLSAYNDENLKWFKENDKQLTALDSWVTATKRDF